MLTLIVGGSASGKSAFAENYAMEAGENRIYIATMQPMDNECLARIEKHRGMRAQKNFQTVECYTGLKQVRVPSTVRYLDILGKINREIAKMADAAAEITAGCWIWHKQGGKIQ